MERHREVVPERLAGLPAGRLGQALQDGRARVARGVDPVTEAHEPPLLAHRVVHEAVHVVERADLEQRAHHRLAGAAVERALQRAHPARHRRVHVGERGRDDPGREGGRVQLVLGVEREARVHRAGGDRARRLPGEHVQEVGGVGELLRRRHRGEPAPYPVMGADGGGELAGQAHRLAQVGRARVVGGVRIVHAEHRDGGLEHPHGIGVARHEGEGADQRVGDGPRRRQLGLEPLARAPRGQLIVPEQVGHVLEGGLPRQLVDVVAAVGQAAVPAVQVAQARLGGHHALQAPDELAALGHR